MLVRLTAKLAEVVNGIDLSHCSEGDIIELPPRQAKLLIAERWAELVAQDEAATCASKPAARAVAADRGRRRRHRDPDVAA